MPRGHAGSLGSEAGGRAAPAQKRVAVERSWRDPPLLPPPIGRRGDVRFGTKSRARSVTTGDPSLIDYQCTIMTTGAHNFKPEVVHTRRAPRGCSQPGQRGGRQGGAAPSSAETEPRLPPFGGGAAPAPAPRTPRTPRTPYPDQEIVE